MTSEEWEGIYHLTESFVRLGLFHSNWIELERYWHNNLWSIDGRE